MSSTPIATVKDDFQVMHIDDPIRRREISILQSMKETTDARASVAASRSSIAEIISKGEIEISRYETQLVEILQDHSIAMAILEGQQVDEEIELKARLERLVKLEESRPVDEWSMREWAATAEGPPAAKRARE